MQVIELIQKKRDRFSLSKEEINYLIRQYIQGSIKDYQMSSLLMAICINGMSDEELGFLTDVMLHSGEVIAHDKNGVPLIDKHSTGGVGDKISIPLAPAIAACGLQVPMIAGRGLGHTGGTLDKLEAIPGFRTKLSIKEYKKQVQEIGCCIMGQTEEIAPADKLIYALRDVTGTVESIPLIASSIMSKKLAEGIEGLVLDVKFGSGAFMKSLDNAKKLANTMVNIGAHMGKKVTARLTNMDQPLGQMIGNSLEILESIDILHGHGPKDSREMTVELGAEMLMLSNPQTNIDDAREQVKKVLESGEAFKKFIQMVQAQGGDTSFIHEPKKFALGPNINAINADNAGFVSHIDNHSIGVAVGLIGGGRAAISDVIDPRVGLKMQVRIGDKIEKDQPLCTLFSADVGHKEAMQRIRQAIVIGDEPVARPPLFADRISTNS